MCVSTWLSLGLFLYKFFLWNSPKQIPWILFLIKVGISQQVAVVSVPSHKLSEKNIKIIECIKSSIETFYLFDVNWSVYLIESFKFDFSWTFKSLISFLPPPFDIFIKMFFTVNKVNWRKATKCKVLSTFSLWSEKFSSHPTSCGFLWIKKLSRATFAVTFHLAKRC